jgi:hypothetical protein
MQSVFRAASPQPSRRQTLALALGAAAFVACVPTAPVSPDAAPTTTLPCTGQGCIPNGQGAPVTEGAPIDCANAEQGLEFFPFDVLNNQGGTAQYFYQYVDGTAGIWPSGYSPPAIPQDVCLPGTGKISPGGDFVLHESGGLFTGWGGGIGVGLEHLNQDAGLCTGATLPPYCPAPGPGALAQAVALAALDVSQWDGISFYARRGPNGQPLMRALVGDKFTDDDISYLMYISDPTTPRLCERKGECTCLYQDATCDWYPDTVLGSAPDPNIPAPSLQGGGYYCGAPLSHPGSASSAYQATNNCSSPTGVCANNYCGRTLCDQPYPAYGMNGPDAEWVGRACTPYTYRNGTQADLCYNPGTDPLPAESDEQCGDHFTFPVHLSTDWQFFAIPFAQMSQQGWAKQAPYFDLTSASVVRFTWDAGYVDYYLDNVRFYRVKRASSPDAGTP